MQNKSRTGSRKSFSEKNQVSGPSPNKKNDLHSNKEVDKKQHTRKNTPEIQIQVTSKNFNSCHQSQNSTPVNLNTRKFLKLDHYFAFYRSNTNQEDPTNKIPLNKLHGINQTVNNENGHNNPKSKNESSPKLIKFGVKRNRVNSSNDFSRSPKQKNSPPGNEVLNSITRNIKTHKKNNSQTWLDKPCQQNRRSRNLEIGFNDLEAKKSKKTLQAKVNKLDKAINFCVGSSPKVKINERTTHEVSPSTLTTEKKYIIPRNYSTDNQKKVRFSENHEYFPCANLDYEDFTSEDSVSVSWVQISPENKASKLNSDFVEELKIRLQGDKAEMIKILREKKKGKFEEDLGIHESVASANTYYIDQYRKFKAVIATDETNDSNQTEKRNKDKLSK